MLQQISGNWRILHNYSSFIPNVKINLVSETCQALYAALHQEVMSALQDDWLKISNDYERCWQMTNCFGRIDGKPDYSATPPNSASVFYSGEHAFSIVLLVVDANYRFIYMDIDSCGCQTNGRKCICHISGKMKGIQ